MKYTPLTNDACESQMAQLDVKVNYSGGAAPVETLCDKQILSANGYLTIDDKKSKHSTLAQDLKLERRVKQQVHVPKSINEISTDLNK